MVACSDWGPAGITSHWEFPWLWFLWVLVIVRALQIASSLFGGGTPPWRGNCGVSDICSRGFTGLTTVSRSVWSPTIATTVASSTLTCSTLGIGLGNMAWCRCTWVRGSKVLWLQLLGRRTWVHSSELLWLELDRGWKWKWHPLKVHCLYHRVWGLGHMQVVGQCPVGPATGLYMGAHSANVQVDCT